MNNAEQIRKILDSTFNGTVLYDKSSSQLCYIKFAIAWLFKKIYYNGIAPYEIIDNNNDINKLVNLLENEPLYLLEGSVFTYKEIENILENIDINKLYTTDIKLKLNDNFMTVKFINKKVYDHTVRKYIENLDLHKFNKEYRKQNSIDTMFHI